MGLSYGGCTSVHGTIAFPPSQWVGWPVQSLKLVFERGKVISFSADSGEDAVRREVAEETNIAVGDCRYLASQPWPFPSALMIGFHAEAGSQSIRLNDAELAEARWISREQIVDREVMLPPPASVAYRLIEAWFNSDSDQPLEAPTRTAPFLRALRPECSHQTVSNELVRCRQ